MKKGQLKIQQMAFMLIAVTLFFVMVGMFALILQVSKLKQTAEVLDEKNALLLATRMANSPEFSCGESYGTGMINCVDADKVMILKKNVKVYDNFWDVSNIQIRTIHPQSNETECNLSNYPNCNIIKLRNGTISSEFSNFVSLCRKENINGEAQNKCELAKIMVSYDDQA